MYYTYIIGWSAHNKFYYGVRYAKKSQPSDLWNTYFTSSKIVKKFRNKHGEPDIIQIRKLFSDPLKARLWEAKVIKKFGMIKDIRFLNQHDGGPKFLNTVNKMPWNKGKKLSEKHKLKIKMTQKGKRLSLEHSDKIKKALVQYFKNNPHSHVGSKNPMFGSSINRGKKWCNDGTISKMIKGDLPAGFVYGRLNHS